VRGSNPCRSGGDLRRGLHREQMQGQLPFGDTIPGSPQSMPSSCTETMSSQAPGQPLAQPNPENKLFIGGAPPGTDEETLKKLFSEHGEVEEVFVMRGGSRSGQACAFIRFTTAEGAVAAIQAIHGKLVMPGCTDPLVVRYADAPGSRAKKGGGRSQGGFNGYAPPYTAMGFGGQMNGGGWGGGVRRCWLGWSPGWLWWCGCVHAVWLRRISS